VSPGRRASPVLLAEIDPDFAQVFNNLRWKVARYRQLSPMILSASTDPMQYQKLGAMVAERQDIYATLHAQAEKMKIGSAYALMRLVETVEALTRRARGREKSPAANAVIAELHEELRRAEKAAEEARVEYIIRRRMAKEAADAAASVSAALKYVEASLG
jgi:hypothetical protein